ncbi:hypothetical protein [Lysobacter tyrosinilyticus]
MPKAFHSPIRRQQLHGALMRRAMIACLLLPFAAQAYQAQPTVKQKAVAPARAALPAQARERHIIQTVTTPVSANLVCLGSKSSTLPESRHGLGCRETPKLIWQSQGCPSNIGCCDVPGNPSGSCLVTSPRSTDTVRGNGIY